MVVNCPDYITDCSRRIITLTDRGPPGPSPPSPNSNFLPAEYYLPIYGVQTKQKILRLGLLTLISPATSFTKGPYTS
jgi:hypothetical protein